MSYNLKTVEDFKIYPTDFSLAILIYNHSVKASMFNLFPCLIITMDTCMQKKPVRKLFNR